MARSALAAGETARMTVVVTVTYVYLHPFVSF